MREKNILLNHFLFLSAFLLIAGCNQSFQPIKDDPNATFSIYGYLDATADTQWVRVIPARQEVNMFDEKPEMYVTLTDVKTGNSTVMNDSLILSWDGRHMLVVWTTMDIEPEHSYTLRAERPDGEESHVTVTTPPRFSNAGFHRKPAIGHRRFNHKGCGTNSRCPNPVASTWPGSISAFCRENGYI